MNHDGQKSAGQVIKEQSQFQSILEQYETNLERYKSLVSRLGSCANSLSLLPLNKGESIPHSPKRESGIISSFQDKLDGFIEINSDLNSLVNHFESII